MDTPSQDHIESTYNTHISATPSLYSDLFNTILRFFASTIDHPASSHDFLRCALVCREWCHIVRSISFADIDYIWPNSLPRLRSLLLPISHNGIQSLPSSSVVNTFVSHVRSATVHILDDWKEVGELLALLKGGFPPTYRLTLHTGTGEIADHHVSLFVDVAAQNLVGLSLSGVKLKMQTGELAALLSDKSLPLLEKLALEVTRPNDLSETTNEEKEEKHFSRTLQSLIMLSREPVPNPAYRSVWPHELFSELRVRKVTIHYEDGAPEELLQQLPATLEQLSPQLEDLDLRHVDQFEDEYDKIAEKIKQIQFTKLVTLRLKVNPGYETITYTRNGYPLRLTGAQGSESSVRYLLERLNAPHLHTLHICMGCIASRVPEQYWKVPGWILGEVDWKAVDDTVGNLVGFKSLRTSILSILMLRTRVNAN
ncbi:hypothetical protein BJ165DRAFT_837406 [Panaeolus papilionaceus]|nr:hypothetical protein BJ165DRAFT_837406 [Panaeolus papilionaceus]